MAQKKFPATVSSSTDVASTGKETDSQLQRGFDRRSLLKGLGVVGVAEELEKAYAASSRQ